MEKTEYKIDAKGKRLGRIASEAASVLLGKNRTDFAKNTVVPVQVTIDNASALDISEKKQDEKIYTHYTGFHGGLRKRTLREIVEKKGISEVVELAVNRMLPANKLRKPRMKNLVINE